MRYPAMLDALHAQVTPGSLVATLSGHVLASPAALARCQRNWPLAPVPSLARLGLACAAVPAADSPEPGAADRFADGLLALHRVLLRQTVAEAIERLGQRMSEGRSLLSRSQLQAELADIAMEIEECAAAPGPAGRAARLACHRRQAAAGRLLLRLFGGSSMLVGGPGADLYLAELAGNIYLEGGDDADNG